MIISSVTTNGIIDLNEDTVENGGTNGTKNDDLKETGENIEVKITSKEVTVEDMLADFVDEVNEDSMLVV